MRMNEKIEYMKTEIDKVFGKQDWRMEGERTMRAKMCTGHPIQVTPRKRRDRGSLWVDWRWEKGKMIRPEYHHELGWAVDFKLEQIHIVASNAIKLIDFDLVNQDKYGNIWPREQLVELNRLRYTFEYPEMAKEDIEKYLSYDRPSQARPVTGAWNE